MKVFLSWSGDCSKKAAAILYEWLPSVLQSVEPYMSAEDIDTGERWSINIATKLQKTNYGIICITPHNIEAPWLLFESGALSKSIANSRVSPILFGLEQSDLSKSPLLQFQVSSFSEADMKKLLISINNSAPEGEKVSTEVLTKAFRRAWAELNDAIQSQDFQISLSAKSVSRAAIPNLSGSFDTAIQEILANTRSQLKLLKSPETVLPPEYINHLFREITDSRLASKTHPAWMELREGTASIRQILSLVDQFLETTNELERKGLAAVITEQLHRAFAMIRGASDYIYDRTYRDPLDAGPKRRSLSSSERDSGPDLK